MNKILGAGLACVDMIYDQKEFQFQNGGTCANVLSVLVKLNWFATILKPQYVDAFDKSLEDTFKNLNVNFLHYKKSKNNTPRIIEYLQDGEHIFKTVCPECNRRILNVDLPSSNDIKKIHLNYGEYDVFFHDRVSSGINNVLEHMKNQHKIVMYEPNSFRNPKIFIDHCKKCDIIKFSGSKIPMTVADNLRTIAPNTEIKIIVNTNGENGLVFCFMREDGTMSSWQRMLPFTSKKVYDTSGAGDWFTAGFLNALLSKGLHLKNELKEENMIKCIEEANKKAKICCESLGAQGVFYEEKQIKKIDKNAEPIISSYEEVISKLGINHCEKCFLNN